MTSNRFMERHGRQETDMELQIGDTVTLKSGGPVMTVTEIETYDGATTVTCCWSEDGLSQTSLYRIEVLERKEAGF